jgi:UDP-N-acetylglucosamine 2-epimerase (non-hydrolysing)/GDP/UDP-N,N'-diacetylbacillosamine 2-epimerase (hydrolysing)
MRILSFTSIRSDYDLLYDLYKLLDNDLSIDLQLIVSGAHLSSSYGRTIDNIRVDGFKILAELETLIDSDSISSRVKTAAIFFQNAIDVVNKFSPDLILFVGDREDAIIIPIIASYLKIPTIHFYGGDHVKDGNVDNPIRNAASKLASVHFVTLNEHKERLIKMGEKSERIHVIGNISLDKIKTLQPLIRSEVAKYFPLKTLPDHYVILIFHPILSNIERSSKDFENIIRALTELDIHIFCSYPNTDAGNRSIIDIIEQNVESNNKFISYKNLSRKIFLSLYYHADFIIGNSSSGILEAASFKKPAINVGDRQVGRYADENVVFCGGELNDVTRAVKSINSEMFRSEMDKVRNSYGDGNSAQKAYELIKKIDFDNFLLKTEDPLEL